MYTYLPTLPIYTVPHSAPMNKRTRGCISIPRTYAHLLHHASCLMQYAYICAHTHTCTRYLSTVHAILCMYAWSGLLDSVSGWEQGTSGKRKKRCKRISRCILHCTALHCTVALSSRLASPGLALHRIASPSQVDTYLYFLVQVSRHVVCLLYITLPVCSLGVVYCHCHHHHRRHTTTLHVLRSGRYIRYVGGYVGGYR